MKLEEVFLNKLFISDLGETQVIHENGKNITLGQYAVWAPIKNAERHQVIEVSDNLNELMAKYNIPEDNVCVLM